jgi:hypothetical protein
MLIRDPLYRRFLDRSHYLPATRMRHHTRYSAKEVTALMFTAGFPLPEFLCSEPYWSVDALNTWLEARQDSILRWCSKQSTPVRMI